MHQILTPWRSAIQELLNVYTRQFLLLGTLGHALARVRIQTANSDHNHNRHSNSHNLIIIILPDTVMRLRSRDMKQGNIPSRSIMFIAPFTNLKKQIVFLRPPLVKATHISSIMAMSDVLPLHWILTELFEAPPQI